MSSRDEPLREKSPILFHNAQNHLASTALGESSIVIANLLFECLESDILQGGLTNGQRRRALDLLQDMLIKENISEFFFKEKNRSAVEKILKSACQTCKSGKESAIEIKKTNCETERIPDCIDQYKPTALTPKKRLEEASLMLGQWLGCAGYLFFYTGEKKYSIALGTNQPAECMPLLLSTIWSTFEFKNTELKNAEEKASIVFLRSAYKISEKLEKNGHLFFKKFLRLI